MSEQGTTKKQVWYEEYKTCSCSFIARDKTDLPGHCPRHQTPKRRRIRIPDQNYKPEDMGYAG
jgi:hypothetical protein